MPELLGRREIDLPRAGPKPNDLMAKHMHTRGLFMLYVILLRPVVALCSTHEGEKRMSQ